MSLNKNNRGTPQSKIGAKQRRARIITLVVLSAMLVFCLAFFTGCDREVLPAPENLEYHHDTKRFTWDEVINSTGGYIIEIDGVEYVAPQTTFLASSLNFVPGEHNARVRALTVDPNYFRDSEWSEYVYFDISIEEAGLTYRLINNGAAYEVASSGTMVFEDKDGNPLREADGSLKPLTIPDTFNGKPVTRIGANSLAYSTIYKIVLGKNITEIANNAFFGCKNLELVDFGENITSIGEYAFFNCSALTEINLPEKLKSIGKSAFISCTGLTEVVIPNNVTSLGANTFESCTSLKKITIGSGITTLPQAAFLRCTSLDEVILGGFEDAPANNGVPVFVSRLEYITRSSFKNCESLETLSIPDTVMTIESDTFTGAGFYTKALDNKTAENDNKGDMLIYIDNWLIGFNSAYLPTAKQVADEEIPIYDMDIASGTKAIANAALSGFTGIKNVVVPESIEKMGTGVFYGCLTLEEVDFRAEIAEIPFRTFATCLKLNKVTLYGDKVNGKLKRIGQEAFADCNALIADGINIPASVTGIGKDAFSGTAIYEDEKTSQGIVYLHNWLIGYNIKPEDAVPTMTLTIRTNTVGMADYSLYWLASLTSVDVPATLEYMGEGAFANCAKLEKIPNISGLSELRAYTFKGCIGLPYDITVIPRNIKKLGNDVFRGAATYAVVLHDEITEIPDRAFYNSRLAMIIIPDSVKTIGELAFANCIGLGSIDLINTIKEMGIDIIGNLEKIGIELSDGAEVVNIPDSVTSIGANAFLGSYEVTRINLSNNITEISEGMFRDCTKLVSVTIPSGVKSIGDHAFRGCVSLTTVSIPASVTTIGSHAFRDCTKLSSFVIPDTVTSIGTYVFKGCTEMRTITLGKGINTISVGMFDSCMLLSNIVLSENIKSIGDYAFANCTSLTTINIGDNIIGMGKHVFFESFNVTIFTEAENSDKWDREWNSSERPVFFYCTFDENKTYVVSFLKSESTIYNPSGFTISRPTRAGHRFEGWNTAANASGRHYSTVRADDGVYDVLLYSIWSQA